MEITEIRKLKAKIEEEIKERLEYFQDRTSLSITEINIMRADKLDGDTEIISVELKVSL